MSPPGEAARHRSRAFGLALACLACIGGCGSTGASGAPDAAHQSDSSDDSSGNVRCATERQPSPAPDDAGAPPCTFILGNPPDANSTNACIDVFVGSQKIAKDVTHTVGWDYVEASDAAIALYGPACTLTQADASSAVTVVYACCGIA